MELNYEKLLDPDYEWTERERAEFIVAYHKQVVEWFMDGIVFPVVYFAAVICIMRFVVFLIDIFTK